MTEKWNFRVMIVATFTVMSVTTFLVITVATFIVVFPIINSGVVINILVLDAYFASFFTFVFSNKSHNG